VRDNLGVPAVGPVVVNVWPKSAVVPTGWPVAASRCAATASTRCPEFEAPEASRYGVALKIFRRLITSTTTESVTNQWVRRVTIE